MYVYVVISLFTKLVAGIVNLYRKTTLISALIYTLGAMQNAIQRIKW
jgi:hypothetical protein